MKKMIYVPDNGKRNGKVNYPKPNEEVMVSQCKVYPSAYDVAGYEYSKDGGKQSISKHLFVEPTNFTNALTKELAEDFIEKDGIPQIERIKIFTTKAEF